MDETNQVQANQGSSIFVGVPEPTPLVTVYPKPDGTGSFVVAKEGYEVHTFDGPKEGYAEHSFDDVASFADYMNLHHIDDAAEKRVDILVQSDSIIAYVNPRDRKPKIVRCQFVKHPAWVAWTEILGETNAQREVQQFVRAWRRTIADSDRLMAVFSAIQVNGSKSMTSHMDETGAVRLASAEGKTDMAVKIPSTIQATVPCYDGVIVNGIEATYDLEVLVSVEVDPIPTFKFTCPTLALSVRQARRDIASQLRDLIDTDFLVGLGKAEHALRYVDPSPTSE